MLININTPVSLSIDKLTDLPKLKAFMEHNNIKLNKSELARQLGIDRRTVDKYLDGYEKPEHRDKPSKLEAYHGTIKDLLSSSTQVFHFRSVLYRYLVDNYGMDVPAQTFYHYLKSVPEFDRYFKKSKVSGSGSNPVIRYETAPGEQAQFDWKESVPFVLRDTGEKISLNVLVLILGNSRFRLYKHHGIIWWLCVGWWWVPIKWLFFTLPALIFAIFGRKKQKAVNKKETMCVCQNCGYSWKV